MGSSGQEEGQKKKAEALEEKKPQGVGPEAPPPQPRVSIRLVLRKYGQSTLG
jgi:hypothetical protein